MMIWYYRDILQIKVFSRFYTAIQWKNMRSDIVAKVHFSTARYKKITLSRKVTYT